MARKRHPKKHRDGGFVKFLHVAISINRKTGELPPTANLSRDAKALYMDIASQYDGKNNGSLSAAFNLMKLFGWSSPRTLRLALLELLAFGFIEQTRQGGKNKCSFYAITSEKIDICEDKYLDVKPTSKPSMLFLTNNRVNIESRWLNDLATAQKTRKQKGKFSVLKNDRPYKLALV